MPCCEVLIVIGWDFQRGRRIDARNLPKAKSYVI
jgi:hypothetical protein